jgi:hypothetical protein
MTFVPGFITLILKYPPSPYAAGSNPLFTCLGRTELYYDFDYFREGGGYANIHGVSPCLERSGISLVPDPCVLSLVVTWLISTFLDIYWFPSRDKLTQ